MDSRTDKKQGFTDASRGERLHKVLAEAGVASRRAAEEAITEGRVRVNGQTVTRLPAWVDPEHDRIDIDGRPVPRRSHRKQGHTYLLINKPRRVISSSKDEHGRRTVVDLVPHGQRLFTVGRLDAESTGLILLTDDGPLAHRLTHPRFGVSKTYEVALKGSLDTSDIEKLRRGMFLADPDRSTAKARAEHIRILQRDREKTRLVVTLREGRNREIRRMMAKLGYKVRRLKRIALGPLQLKGVAAGEWRELTRSEVRALREAAKG